MSYDQIFRTEAGYNTFGKWPYIYFADTELGTSLGYVNTSLEGRYFDEVPLDDGQIIIPNGPVTPNFAYYVTRTDYIIISSASVAADGTVTITCLSSVETWGLEVGDLVTVTGIPYSTSQPYINGTWRTASVSGNNFTYESTAPFCAGFAGIGGSSLAAKGPAFEIRDNRPTTDAKGYSFTSVLFTPKPIHDVASPYVRILPSDLYTRFRFQSANDADPQGGINSNLFNVIDGSNNNIKPVLWAYFFGFNDTVAPDNVFEVAFNSYAIVLRPTGEGSRLEFAIVKFNWGTIADWFNDIVDAGYDRFTDWTVGGTDLGYLISTNPEVGKVAGNSVVEELAKSDSFTYNAEFAAKFNLKISIRKHLLSDSPLDGTYLVSLLVNDNYDVFGEGFHYDSILHTYITKPTPLYNTITQTIAEVIAEPRTIYPEDYMLMPMMYFKFNNTNENNVGAWSASNPGSSRIIQDNLIYRQLNYNADYLY